MPPLSKIKYSHEETVSAISGYFDFLAAMYLDEDAIQRPPEGGWPEITPDRLRGLGKTDKVVELLRHIPYLRGGEWCDQSEAEAAPSGIHFYNWIEAIRQVDHPDSNQEIGDPKIFTEPPEDWGLVPAHVVGLITTKQDLWLLDTELGVIYWVSGPGWICLQPTREPVLDDAYDIGESETDWRLDPSWAIVDFFELLKDAFRQLNSIPLTPTVVLDPKSVKLSGIREEALALVQTIYREHGWPDMARYRKNECLMVIRETLKERYGEECRQLFIDMDKW
ncbi:hypothetical protein N657DRAFT_246400 [Parathielavia appendiculata]|uniref:Uncharacterized protein n=1 Tax=Parathielavia appendiculata TaxID=2587402 RepID=A0AAN6YZF6_9PEZI|nr:hypothetical protein N657DRAFT_246400 [Parathielavia appendiculata]